MEKWNRSPKHIMRKECIEYVVKDLKPSSFIEFGAGTGDLTSMFLEKGYYGKCYDLGEDNRKILKENLKRYRDQIEIIDDLKELDGLLFDYLFAFEVLEHIKDDYDVLKQWSSYLNSKGKLLISVPAHTKIYSKDDEFVGHIRRYEKVELFKLLAKTGYKNINILNYGFPLGNITRIINNLLSISVKRNKNLSFEERSIKSGVERAEIVNKLSFLFNDNIIFPFSILQRFFFKKDMSDGYVAYAEKK